MSPSNPGIVGGDYLDRDSGQVAHVLQSTLLDRVPSRMMATVSHSCSTSERMWLDSTDTPSARRCLTTSWNSRSMGVQTGGRFVQDQQLGVEASAAISATFCRLPLEYARAFLRGIQLESFDQLLDGAVPRSAAHPAR